jgi:hypothetical protein
MIDASLAWRIASNALECESVWNGARRTSVVTGTTIKESRFFTVETFVVGSARSTVGGASHTPSTFEEESFAAFLDAVVVFQNKRSDAFGACGIRVADFTSNLARNTLVF